MADSSLMKGIQNSVVLLLDQPNQEIDDNRLEQGEGIDGNVAHNPVGHDQAKNCPDQGWVQVNASQRSPGEGGQRLGNKKQKQRGQGENGQGV